MDKKQWVKRVSAAVCGISGIMILQSTVDSPAQVLLVAVSIVLLVVAGILINQVKQEEKRWKQ